MKQYFAKAEELCRHLLLCGMWYVTIFFENRRQIPLIPSYVRELSACFYLLLLLGCHYFNASCSVGEKRLRFVKAVMAKPNVAMLQTICAP